MAGLVDNVSMALSMAGYRTGNANPGHIMPEIEEPVVAVELAAVDTGNYTASVRATVVSPLALGARRCEDEAWRVCKLLTDMGANCNVAPSSLNRKMEIFQVPVTAVFQGNVWDPAWQAGTGVKVKLGTVTLQKIQSFSAWREADKDTGSIENSPWKFRVEERTDKIQSEFMPAAPFSVTVSLSSGKEVYGSCQLTLRKRILKDGFVQQIWEGTGQTRTVTV